VYIAYGVVVWFVFLLLIRNFGPALATPGSVELALTFVALVPISYALVWVVGLLGARGADLLPAVALATVPALLLDAMALTYSTLYGAAALTGAAWLLWGVGWILIFAWFGSRTRADATQ
jgi:hypothetical protein